MTHNLDHIDVVDYCRVFGNHLRILDNVDVVGNLCIELDRLLALT